MAYNQQMSNKDWEAKESRDLFVRVVNTIIMGRKDELLTIEDVTDKSKKIVDKAFEFYPSEEKHTDEFGAPEIPIKDE